jgi:hypothetical protein
LVNRRIPLVGERFAISALLGFIWIIGLYGIIIGVWWSRLRDYFEDRGRKNGILDGNHRLAAIALTGHLCDVTMGMVLIPVSRHSALASFFKLSVSTTLTFHMLTAYTLFTLVLIHGFLYVSWVPAFNSLSERFRTVFPVLNPTYLYYEIWPGNSSALVICLHASTVFYCVAPGLAMWVLDWGMRLYELRECVPGKVAHLGKGWYWYVDSFMSSNRPS